MADVRIINQTEITSLSGGEFLITDSSSAGTKKITPSNLVKSAGVGDLTDLDTTDKSSVVAAINEVAQGGGVSGVTSVNGMTGAVVIPTATTSANGLMSSTDKSHLDTVYADYSSALTALGVI